MSETWTGRTGGDVALPRASRSRPAPSDGVRPGVARSQDARARLMRLRAARSRAARSRPAATAAAARPVELWPVRESAAMAATTDAYTTVVREMYPLLADPWPPAEEPCEEPDRLD